MIRLVDRAVFWSLVGLVVLSPIPFGSIYPWSWTLMGVVVGVLLLAWCLRYAVSTERFPVGLHRIWPFILPFALVCLWIVAQMSPWTPESWHHPMWKTAAEATGLPLAGRISANPFDSGSMLMRLLTYGGIFWLALQYGRSSRNAHRMVQILAVAGLVYAAYGLVIEFTGAKMVLWYDKEAYQDNLTSTFRYKNAYATYAGLGLLCAVSLLFRGLDEVTAMGLGPRATLHQMLHRLLERDWIYALAAMIVVSALFLSDSRAGAMSGGFGLMVLLGAIAMRRVRLPRLVRPAIAILAVGFLAVASFSGETTLDRIGTTEFARDVRSDIYRATERAIGDFRWTGTGAGAYAEAFAAYHPPEIPTLVLRAHSSYLENAMELGIPGAAMLAVPLVWLAVLCGLGIRRRRRDSIFPCLGLGAVSLVALHAAFDFTLQEPAVAVTFTMLAGAACAQSWSTRNGSEN